MSLVSKVLAQAADLGPAPATFKDLEKYASRILNVATGFVGIVVFIMLLVGGFKLLFSGGNPEELKKASGSITWAIVGLVLLIAIWLIFLFVEEFTGVTITEFHID